MAKKKYNNDDRSVVDIEAEPDGTGEDSMENFCTRMRGRHEEIMRLLHKIDDQMYNSSRKEDTLLNVFSSRIDAAPKNNTAEEMSAEEADDMTPAQLQQQQRVQPDDKMREKTNSDDATDRTMGVGG